MLFQAQPRTKKRQYCVQSELPAIWCLNVYKATKSNSIKNGLRNVSVNDQPIFNQCSTSILPESIIDVFMGYGSGTLVENGLS